MWAYGYHFVGVWVPLFWVCGGHFRGRVERLNRESGLRGWVKDPKKVGQESLFGCWVVIFGCMDVTLWVASSDRETRCEIPRTSERHFPSRKIVTFRVVECSLFGCMGDLLWVCECHSVGRPE